MVTIFVFNVKEGGENYTLHVEGVALGPEIPGGPIFLDRDTLPMTTDETRVSMLTKISDAIIAKFHAYFPSLSVSRVEYL